MPDTRGLCINITIELIEELLVKNIKNVPSDIKFITVERELYHDGLKLYFKSKRFPIVKDQLKENVVTGRVEATVDKTGKLIGVELKWRDPNKKEKN